LREPFSNLGGFDPNHGIASCVVIDRAPEHLGPDHPLSQAVDFPFQHVFNDQTEEVRGTLTSCEGMACQDALEVKPH
jgi:hypothetical protein